MQAFTNAHEKRSPTVIGAGCKLTGDIKTDHTDYERYDIPVEVDHVGYVGTNDEKRLKAERNNALLFKEIERKPEEPYFYFQVAQSYNLMIMKMLISIIKKHLSCPYFYKMNGFM